MTISVRRVVLSLLGFALSFSLSAQAGLREKVLIRASKPYTNLVAAIQSRGGTVTHQFRYVNGIAAEIPRDQIAAIRNLVGPNAITKDDVVPAPEPRDGSSLRSGLTSTGDETRMEADSAQVLSGADIAAMAQANPTAYTVNNGISRASALHATGNAGQGVIVAVIDSGIRPGFPHISLDGSVIGCEDFVGDALGCSNFGNSGHGTFVAGMISANVVFTFSPASALRNAVLAECPGCFSNPPVNTQIPMIGSAPLSSIYAFRVFGPTGGSPTSRILAAMERVIELRELFDAGQPGGSNIQVCNMSLGGATLFAGRDLFDTAADVLIQKGIVSSVAAGNAGPSSLTVGSPGSHFGALTVGAASLAHNERILRRVQFGAAAGSLYRPFLGTQTSYFSGRGPNADGRSDPDVTANGFANYGQGTGATTGTISLGSGTSFSTPSLSGVAALLRLAHPTATAVQIRNAIVASANPALLDDDSTVLDRGAGYVDALAASNLLAGGSVPNTLPSPGNPNKSVKVNIEQGTFLNVLDGNNVNVVVSSLKPGERHDILYRVSPNTSNVTIRLTNVTPALPPAQQNQLFGDDILLAVHSAKTSSIGEGDYQVFTFTTGGTFTINNPERGIMRVTVNGDWTNAGNISANVNITSQNESSPQKTASGKISEGQTLLYSIPIPAGVAQADFRLEFREDWGNYPTSDIDMILVRPNGTLITDGSTLNCPERAVVNNPAAGNWLVVVSGFEIWTGDDKFELRVALDGNVVK